MRTCTDATKTQIAAIEYFRPMPGWLRAAISDCQNCRPVSLKRERRMCEALGIEPPPALVAVEPCPDCGGVHTGRCHGHPVATVAVLAPGESVKRAPRPRREPSPELAAMVRGLQTCLERKTR